MSDVGFGLKGEMTVRIRGPGALLMASGELS